MSTENVLQNEKPIKDDILLLYLKMDELGLDRKILFSDKSLLVENKKQQELKEWFEKIKRNSTTNENDCMHADDLDDWK